MGEPYQQPRYNRFTRAKLIGTKWTRLKPQDAEKHFMIVEWDPEREEQRDTVVIEAVLTRRMITLPVNQLKDRDTWRMGWH